MNSSHITKALDGSPSRTRSRHDDTSRNVVANNPLTFNFLPPEVREIRNRLVISTRVPESNSIFASSPVLLLEHQDIANPFGDPASPLKHIVPCDRAFAFE
jgi:hypothetical protein